MPHVTSITAEKQRQARKLRLISRKHWPPASSILGNRKGRLLEIQAQLGSCKPLMHMFRTQRVHLTVPHAESDQLLITHRMLPDEEGMKP